MKNMTIIAAVLLIAAGGAAVGVGVVVGTTTGTADGTQETAFNVDVAVERSSTVDQGATANITTWVDNKDSAALSNFDIEILVDKDEDGTFESSEIVGTRTGNVSAFGYDGFPLVTSTIQLSCGDYDYMARVSKNGQRATDSSNNTLTVQNCGGSTPFNVGVELEQSETVDQGSTVDITTWVNNRESGAVSGLDIEILVDEDKDGSFESGEVVATQTGSVNGSEYKGFVLTTSAVQLSCGDYDYMSRVSKSGKTTDSFTNGTLTVQNCGGSTPLNLGIELQQSANVSQNSDVTISAFVRNNGNQDVSNVQTSLFVDANDNGAFDSGESVATQSRDYVTGGVTQVNLTATNVQYAPGNYTYGVRAELHGQTVWSYTNGTLTVDSSTGSPLSGPAGQYDGDGNGQLDIRELGIAAADFAAGSLTINDLGQVAAAFAQS